jgi:hypothetical protein
VELTTYARLIPTLRINTATPPQPHTSPFFLAKIRSAITTQSLQHPQELLEGFEDTVRSAYNGTEKAPIFLLQTGSVLT